MTHRFGMSQCKTCVQALRPLTPSELWSLLVDSAMQMCWGQLKVKITLLHAAAYVDITAELCICMCISL